MPPASERAPGLSRAVDAVLERGLAKGPRDRWETAARFVDELARTLSAEPTGPTKPLRRRRGGAGAGGAAPPEAAARSGDWDDQDVAGYLAGGAQRDFGAAAHADGPGGRGRDDGATRAYGGRRRGTTSGRRAPAAAPERRNAAPLLIALIALVILASAGVFALARGGGSPDKPSHQPRAQHTPKATATADKTEKPTATPTASATDSPAPTSTPSAAPTATDTPQNTSGSPDLKRASQLQIEGYNARRAGDFNTALQKSRAAEQACGSAHQLSPCGYAMFEEGVALTALGQPDAAIPILQRRLDEYGDNNCTRSPRRSRRPRRRREKTSRARPWIRTPSPRARPAALERGLQPRQRDHGLGGVGALVALAAAGAGERLVHVLDRQHAERARDAGAQLHVHDPARGLGADVVVVVGLAADDRAEAGDAGVAPGLGQELGGQRQLEGAGDVEDVGLRAGLRRRPGRPLTSRSASSS